MIELSVTSMVSSSAGTPAASRLPPSQRGSSRSASSRADRFTATDSSGCVRRIRLRVCSDDSTENRVRAEIRPLFSAIGMKMSGETRPWNGWFQRISDSTATRAPVWASTWGW